LETRFWDISRGRERFDRGALDHCGEPVEGIQGRIAGREDRGLTHAVYYNVFMSPDRERGQLSMRPSKRTLERLRERARLLGEKHTTLAERYLEEGVTMDDHPGIHFVDGALGRRPAVLGSGLDVWEIVEVAKDNRGSVLDTASYLEIDPRLVETALRYYGADRDEIDDWIERVHALNKREETTWRAAQEAISA
jgi:hypothetical protein